MAQIQFRTFRNTDPPQLVRLWNDTFTGRATAFVRQSSSLEYFHFAKPYFDPASLIVAQEGDRLVGLVQAGFGPDDTEQALDRARGVVCLLGVHPEYRGQGIGTELLARAEGYLHGHGTVTLYAGPQAPLNPYTFGLYGGSESPGFLLSDGLDAFLLRRGYQRRSGQLVYQRALDRSLGGSVDPRLATLRRRFELRTVTRRTTSTWYQECVRGPIEVVELRLEEKGTGREAGRLLLWEMDTFGLRWNENAIGILGLEVREDLRRQGLGRLMLQQVLRYYHEQYFTLAEAQVRQGDETASAMLLSLGFRQIDEGYLYQKGDESARTNA